MCGTPECATNVIVIAHFPTALPTSGAILVWKRRYPTGFGRIEVTSVVLGHYEPFVVVGMRAPCHDTQDALQQPSKNVGACMYFIFDTV